MTTIITKNSNVADAVPVANDLVEGEVALNTEDGRLFSKNQAAAIVQLAPSTVDIKEVQKVTALPGTPDANTVYFVVP